MDAGAFPAIASITRKENKAMEGKKKKEKRRAEIMDELEGPIEFETAVMLLDELRDIDADLSGYPGDEIEFGSAEWFQAVDEIPLPVAEVDGETIEGFPLYEAERIVQIYVCAQCEGDLRMIPSWIDGNVWLIECPDDGNIEQVGRISRTTVAIRRENAINKYLPYIRRFPHLWGDLLERHKKKITPVTVREGETRKQAISRELGF